MHLLFCLISYFYIFICIISICLFTDWYIIIIIIIITTTIVMIVILLIMIIIVLLIVIMIIIVTRLILKLNVFNGKLIYGILIRSEQASSQTFSSSVPHFTTSRQSLLPKASQNNHLKVFWSRYGTISCIDISICK